MIISNGLCFTIIVLLVVFSLAKEDAQYYFLEGQKLQYGECLNSLEFCNYKALSKYKLSRSLVSNPKLVKFDFPGMLNDMGILMSTLGYTIEAGECFEEAIKLDSQLRTAIVNLAGLRISQARNEEAGELYRKALLIGSRDKIYATILYNFGIFVHNKGREFMNDSWAIWQEAVLIDQSLFPAYANLASLSCSHKIDHQEADMLYANAMSAALLVNNQDAYWSLNLQRQSSVLPIIASQSHEMDVNARRLYVKNLKDLLINSPGALDSINVEDVSGCGCLGYYAIYQGYEDLYLRQLFANVHYRFYQRSLWYEPPFLTQETANSNTVNPIVIRVGFLSSFLCHHSVGVLLQGVIKQLDRALFDVFLLHTRGSRGGNECDPDYLTHNLLTSVEQNRNRAMFDAQPRYIVLNQGLRQSQQVIGSLQLDVLVFGEIGMSALPYFLGFSRLARRSILFWGHALTSGIRSSPSTGTSTRLPHSTGGPDYFVSSTLFETNGKFSQFEYSERLILMSGMTTYFEWPNVPLHNSELFGPTKTLPEPWRSIKIAKERIQRFNLTHLIPMACMKFTGDCEVILPQKRDYLVFLDPTLNELLPNANMSFRMYAVPQTLYKIHSDFDDILMNLLQQDSQAFVVFPKSSNPAHTSAVIQRLTAHFTENKSLLERIIFVRQMSEREFLTFCGVSDVVLDPFPVGGGRSSLEVFSTGIPIVTLYPRTSILQLTSAMYNVMGIDSGRSCVTMTNVEYVRKAISIASNFTLFQSLRTDITANNYRLYENQSVITEWQDMLVYVVSSPRPEPLPINMQQIQDIVQSTSDADDAIQYLREAYVYLVSNKQWITDELWSVQFPFALPPLVLADVQTAISISIDNSEPNAASNDFLKTNSSEFLARIQFQDVDKYGETRARQITVGLHDDWREACVLSLVSHNITDRLKILYVCTITGRAVARIHWDQIYDLAVEFPSVLDNTLQHINVSLKRGDDLGQVVHELSDYNKHISPEIVEQVASYFINNVMPVADMGSVAAVKQRSHVARDWLQWFEQHRTKFSIISNLFPSCLTLDDKAHDVGTPKNRQVVSGGITLGVTTSNRLSHFKHTMSRLVHGLGGALPNGLVTHVIVIDDSSSESDRLWMMQAYPQCTFLFKSGGERGHANSMNKLLQLVTTQYLLYLEDDWLLLDQPLAHVSLAQGLDAWAQAVHFTCSNNQPAGFNTDSLLVPYLVPVLLSALSILGHQDSVQVPCVYVDNLNSTFSFAAGMHMTAPNDHDQKESEEHKVHLVLFNEQSSRACAVGAGSCQANGQAIGLGGWSKYKDAYALTSALSSAAIRTHYSLHEFGLAPDPAAHSYGDRNHEFTYWPGFSLNPGLWSMPFFRSLMHAAAESNGDAQEKLLFHESDVAFEQRFSMRAYSSGLQMGYLAAVVFSHAGQLSAYHLNNITRPWETV